MHPPCGQAHLVHVLWLEHAIGVEVDVSMASVSHSRCSDGAPALPAAQMELEPAALGGHREWILLTV